MKGLREAWPVRPIFIFACLCLVFAPTLIDEFPYLCANYGGFLFLILLAILWVTYAFPLIGIEITLGHFLRGPVGVFGAFPILRSFSWATVLYQLIYCPQLAFKTALHAYYLYLVLFGSYDKVVKSCENPWNTKNCCSPVDFVSYRNATSTEKCTAPTSILEHVAFTLENNASAVIDSNPLGLPKPISWYQLTLPLAISVASVWGMVYFFVFLGPISIGALGSFSVIGIVGCFVALGLKFAHFEGAADGRRFGIAMNFSKINEAKAWGEASIFVRRIAAVGTGSWPTLASFNWPSSNWFNFIDLALLSLALFAALVGVAMFAFSVQGYLSSLAGLEPRIRLFADRRLSHTLYTIPLALSTLSPEEAKTWSAVFYLANLLLGLTSLVIMTEVVNSALVCVLQHSMNLRRLHIYRPLIAFLTMTMLTACSLIFTCKESGYGAYLFAIEYSDRLIITFVFIELAVFIAYTTMKLVRTQRQLKGYVQCFLLSLLVLLVFLVLLGTILFLTYDILHNQAADHLRPMRSLAGWLFAGVPLMLAGVGLLFTVLGSILYAVVNNRSLSHVLCHPRLPREPLLVVHNDVSLAMGNGQEYGQFDMGPLRP